MITMTSVLSKNAVRSSCDTASGRLQCIVRPLTDMLDEYAAELETLFDQTPHPHPVLHPDCLKAWFCGTLDVPETDVRMAALLDGPQIVCAGVLDPWNLTIAGLPGTKRTWQLHGRRLFGKGLLWNGRAETLAEWLTAISRILRDRSWGGLMIEALAVDTFLWQGLSKYLQQPRPELKLLRPHPVQPRWRIRLPDTVEDYWKQQFRGKTRNTLRRKRRRLGSFEVTVCTQPEDVPEFLEAAHEVSQQTWQSRELGLRVRNSLQERRLYETLAARAGFRGYIMRRDDRPVAFVINTCHQGYVHYEETGFVSDLARLSPGTVLVSELIDDIIRSGTCHTLDFGLGHADYKQLFSNVRTHSSDVWLLPNGPVAAAAAMLISCRTAVHRAARGVLQRSGLLQRLRRRRRS